MAIFGWLKQTGGNSAPEAGGNGSKSPSEQALEIERSAKLGNLPIETALMVHGEWCKRFEDVVKGANPNNPGVAAVSADNLCDLGKWIHGEANILFSETALLEYKELVRVHREFHTKAGEILRLFNAKNTTAAEVRLNELLTTHSDVVRAALIAFYRAIHRAWIEMIKKGGKSAGYPAVF